MNSARPLVLTKDQHALLGELVEIIGLNEHMLAQSAARFDPAAAASIRKAPGGLQGDIWAGAIKSRLREPELAARVAAAKQEIEDVAEERNDFIHALFEGDYVEAGYVEPGYQTTSAIRSKTGKARPVSDLITIRDRAAKLSCQIAQIASEL